MTRRVTPAYKWDVPTSDEFLRDGADDIGSLGDQIDATLQLNVTQLLAADKQLAAADAAISASMAGTVRATHVHDKGDDALKIYANRRAGDVLQSFLGAWVVKVPIPTFTDVYGALAIANKSAGFNTYMEVAIFDANPAGELTIAWNVAGAPSPAPGPVAVDVSYCMLYAV